MSVGPKIKSGGSTSHKIEKIQPTEPMKTEAMDAYCQKPFDQTLHRPPRVDSFGYNIETHKGRELIQRSIPNVLAEQDKVKIPTWWLGKRIRDKGTSVSLGHEGFSTLQAAGSGRANTITSSRRENKP